MNTRSSPLTYAEAKVLPRARFGRSRRASLLESEPGPTPQPEPEPVPVAAPETSPDPTPEPVSAPAPERASGSSIMPWWTPAREPREFSTLHLGRNREEWGGDFLVLSLSKQDGEMIVASGIDRFSLERIANRMVTISLHREVEEGNRWGLHKLRRVKADRPHIRFLVKDLDLPEPLQTVGIVGRRRPPDRVSLRISRNKITFKLPAGIR